jgi:hypothetical protein
MPRMTEVWTRTEASLPLGWWIDSLRCASTGLAPHLRSDRWIAIAMGPEGESLQGEGGSADQAMANLANRLREWRGSISG